MPGRSGLFVASILVSLLALELLLRAFHPAGSLTRWSNFVLDARTVLVSTEQSRFTADDRVGVVPKGGLRGNGAAALPEGLPFVLAAGDSYTYGEEVADDQTWPAHLEARLRLPVLNGGVSSYGFDQIVLRAEILAAERKPAAIVVSFIADDIHRTEMRRVWGAEKPYFDLAGDGLALRNVPVPPRPDPRTTLTFWQRTLGYSFLIDFVLRRFALMHDWFGDHVRVHPAGDGERIACRLTARLADLQKRAAIPVLIFAQYDPVVWQDAAFSVEQRRLTGGLLRCAAERGLATLDSFNALAARAGDAKRLYVLWHMSDEGNRLMADLLAGALAGKLR